MTLNRRKLLENSAAFGATIFGATMFGTAPVLAGDGGMYDVKKLMNPEGMADHFLGSKDAKVTVIEYASSTCPVCANFHEKTYPMLKETYIDSDKILFVLRPFVLNLLDMVVFMLAYEAGKSGTEHYYALLDSFLKTQPIWTKSSNPKQAIFDIAKQHGFNEESFEEVLTNKELFEGIEALKKQASREFDVHGTPSFYINGKMLVGNYTFEEMAKEIDPMLS